MPWQPRGAGGIENGCDRPTASAAWSRVASSMKAGEKSRRRTSSGGHQVRATGTRFGGARPPSTPRVPKALRRGPEPIVLRRNDFSLDACLNARDATVGSADPPGVGQRKDCRGSRDLDRELCSPADDERGDDPGRTIPITSRGRRTRADHHRQREGVNRPWTDDRSLSACSRSLAVDYTTTRTYQTAGLRDNV